MARIAYILLCHKDPEGIIAQAQRLTAVGDFVAIHFDGRAKPSDFDKIRAVLATIGGTAAAWLGGLYLLHYAESAAERAQVQRFMRLHTATAALFCGSTLLVVVLHLGLVVSLATLLVGMCAINYQYLVTLPRIMGPMLARDAARHGRSGPTRLYNSLFGRSAVAVYSVLVVASVLYVLLAR